MMNLSPFSFVLDVKGHVKTTKTDVESSHRSSTNSLQYTGLNMSQYVAEFH